MNTLFGDTQAPAGSGLLNQRKNSDVNEGNPSQLEYVIKQIKNASLEERKKFSQKIVQAIQSAPEKTAEEKKAVIQEFMKAMSL